MIVVADTSPLNYLVRIGHISVLPSLYGQVLLPTEVVKELRDPRAPSEVVQWASVLPDWVVVQSPTLSLQAELDGLDAGERAAIELAVETNAKILLINERKARRVAESVFGFTVFGTLGILSAAHKAHLINGEDAFQKLSALTNFYQNAELRLAFLRSLKP